MLYKKLSYVNIMGTIKYAFLAHVMKNKVTCLYIFGRMLSGKPTKGFVLFKMESMSVVICLCFLNWSM